MTGPPKVGKTTVVERLMPLLAEHGVAVRGFVSSEIRREGTRVGFRVRDLSDGETVLAHVDSASRVRVGRFGVEVAAFESVAVPALEAALTSDDVIVIDEIASMELASAAFTALVPEIMTGRQVVVATMHSRAHPVTDAIRRARVVEIINVTVDNRDGLPQLLLSRIMQR